MDLKRVLDQAVRELKREVNKKVLKVPEIEIKICEATSNEPWGPHGTIMGDIAQATRNLQEYHLIMGVLWKRLHDSGKNWRHVYKSLAVMEYLIANGAERVVDELRAQAYQIQTLLDFQYIEPNGKDQGINVQKKAQSILALINDRGKIREFRQKAAANRDKYRGLSSSEVTFKACSYLSTSGSGDEEQYGGASSAKELKEGVEGKDLECRPQRDESNRDECNCGEREHNECCASSKAGDPNSDNVSSTEGERSHDTDEYRQYSRASGNPGVVAAVTRPQTNLSQPIFGSASKLRDHLFFTINPADKSADDDFDPRGASKILEVPGFVAKDEFSVQSHNALEDLFADVEFQVSYPPTSSTALDNIFEDANLQTSEPNSCFPPPLPPFNNSIRSEYFRPMRPAFDSFNPTFASFDDESPKSTTQGALPNDESPHSNSNHHNFSAHEHLNVGRSSKAADIFNSGFNPFSLPLPDHGTKEGSNCNAVQLPPLQRQPQPQPPCRNPFLSTTSSSAFWDDPLIISLADLSMGPKPDQMVPLGVMNKVSVNMAASVSRPSGLPVGGAPLSMTRHMNSSSTGIGTQNTASTNYSNYQRH